ncbi:MAG: M48 family metallopeptidase [Candidatus Xenobia bacterium]
MTLKHRVVLLLTAVCCLLAPAWADVPPDQRKAVSDQMMYQLQQQTGRASQLSPEARAQQIFNVLVAHAQRHDVHYRLEVVPSKEINAESLPDGRVVFYSALLDKLANADPSAIAFVEAHEISHIEDHHADKKVEATLGSAVFLGLLVQNSGLGVQIAALAAHQMLNSGYSRSLEAQADRDGMALMQRSGYDPNGALVVFKMFEKMEGQGMRVFPTHPRATDRYANAVAWMQEHGVAIHAPGTLPPAVAGNLPAQTTAYHGQPLGGPYTQPTPPIPAPPTTPGPGGLPQMVYSNLDPAGLMHGTFDPTWEQAISQDVISRIGYQMHYDANLGESARMLTNQPSQPEVSANRVIAVALIPPQWTYAEWRSYLDRNYISALQTDARGFDLVGVAVKTDNAGMRHIVMVLGTDR